MDETRRTIREFVQRYRLEPSIRDVFVEGLFDKDVVDRFARLSGRRDVAVFLIDAVDVSAEDLARLGLTTGARQRVAAFSSQVEAAGVGRNVFPIVDLDLDHIVPPAHSFGLPLRATDFVSMECYFWKRHEIGDILSVLAKAKTGDLPTLVNSIESVLRGLFCLRVVGFKRGLQLTWIDCGRCITTNGDSLIIDLPECTRRVLNASGVAYDIAAFARDRDEVMAVLPADSRLAMRGHDLTMVLSVAIRRFRGLRQFADPHVLERVFVHNLEKFALNDHPLFKALLVF